MKYDAVLSQNCAKWRAEYSRSLMEAGNVDAAIFYQQAAAYYYRNARQLMGIE